MRLIGDIHGKTIFYKRMLKDCDRSIQVGDYGIGFVPNIIQSEYPHRFIRGNHDDPKRCESEINYIADGITEVIDDRLVMFCGGAFSIDKDWRTPMLDWWPDEELSMGKFETVIENYNEIKPEIMITHDCPESIIGQFNIQKFDIRSITQFNFDIMFRNHKPKLWVFGHWHFKFDQVIDGTRFICVDQDHFIDIDFKSDLRDPVEQVSAKGLSLYV